MKDASDILSNIPINLRSILLDEYNKLSKNYQEGRWEPAEINGGKLCEIVYTILKGHTDGNFPSIPKKPKNMLDACKDLEKEINFPRSIRIQIPRMIVALYEIRNNRNVGHLGADVNPSHMDATVVLSIAKWILSELIRVFHNTTTEHASEAVELLTERTLPIIWKVGNHKRVLGNNLSAEEKMLVLLYGTDAAQPVTNIIKSLEYSNPSRFRSLLLTKAHKEDLIHYDKKNDTIEISPIGSRYVEENITLEI